MSTNKETLKKLHLPFYSHQISWRPGSTDTGNTMAQALPYIDNRDVQDRLDAVVGADGWQSEFVEVVGQGRLIAVRCILSICVDGAWLKKSDAAPPPFQADNTASGVDMAVKGAYSDAMKRAAVQWGIGRYLYAYRPQMVQLDDKGNIVLPPALPPELLPSDDPALAEPALKEPVVTAAAEDAQPPEQPLAAPLQEASPQNAPSSQKSLEAPVQATGAQDEPSAAGTLPVAAEPSSVANAAPEAKQGSEVDPATMSERDTFLAGIQNEAEKKIAVEFLQRLSDSSAHERLASYLAGPAASKKLKMETHTFLSKQLDVAKQKATPALATETP